MNYFDAFYKEENCRIEVLMLILMQVWKRILHVAGYGSAAGPDQRIFGPEAQKYWAPGPFHLDIISFNFYFPSVSERSIVRRSTLYSYVFSIFHNP
ncbi:hypothetical protein Zmor_011046 [Zophobas morio]|uniref:Uncharacterized protein n=1 Tax=Zophobas morio TaxID=2755281 RepID=A0AA38IQE0_9CUCU|nr:hypothetical protein Zmor_011046 [Zophobas morio]